MTTVVEPVYETEPSQSTSNGSAWVASGAPDWAVSIVAPLASSDVRLSVQVDSGNALAGPAIARTSNRAGRTTQMVDRRISPLLDSINRPDLLTGPRPT